MSQRAAFQSCMAACCCRECNPELAESQRGRKRVVEALRCGCLVCEDYLRSALNV